MPFKFEKLDVWQEAIKFTDDIYKVTTTFPSKEQFGLVSQLRRSAISISANIAEGSGRYSDADFQRFLRMALGSIFECVSELHIAKNQKFLKEEDFLELYQHAEKNAKMLTSLIGSLEK